MHPGHTYGQNEIERNVFVCVSESHNLFAHLLVLHCLHLLFVLAAALTILSEIVLACKAVVCHVTYCVLNCVLLCHNLFLLFV